MDYSLILGILIGILLIVSYILGIRTGLKLKNGEIPNNPIKEVTDIPKKIKRNKAVKKESKELAKMQEGINNIMNYDGGKQ